jgi:hypothetical protein
VKLLVMLQKTGKTVREQDKRAIATDQEVRKQGSRRVREQDNRRVIPWEIAWQINPTRLAF